jgi:D-glycero-D-manno-heptose 1,7-bisphosphate phosphatase
MGVGAVRRQRAVFLDRDGVINRAVLRDGKPYPPATLEEFDVLPGVPVALAALRDAGFLRIVVTNQPDLARGVQTREAVEAMHARLTAELPVDEVRVCPHDDGDACECRKPQPGLILEAARERGLDLSASYVVGDRWRDVEAGRRAGCTTVLVDYGYAEAILQEPDARVSSLSEAARWILERERTR